MTEIQVNDISDLISRKSLLEEIEEEDKEATANRHLYINLEEIQSAVGRIIDIIKDQPAISNQETGRWIPCSECLPEHDGQVLIQVSGKYRNIFFEDAFELAEYDKNEGWILEAYPEWKNPDVTAWQPLPAPYNPDREYQEEESESHKPVNEGGRHDRE